MSAKLTITIGLPASGKSTWALEQVWKRAGHSMRVNRDDLRSMCNGTLDYSKGREKIVRAARDALIREGLRAGLHVYCDDTCLQPGVQEHLMNLAVECGAEFEVEDFTHVPVETCIERDLKRDRTVGEKVIRKMWNDHLKADQTIQFDESLPKAIIFDMDGTLALMKTRTAFEYEKVGEDEPNEMVVDALDLFASRGYAIIILSARESKDRVRQDTEAWLSKHGITYVALHMRAADDFRKDHVVKREILERDILPHWRPVLVIDDRDQVVRLWRDVGLPCWQVADGAF